MHVATVVNEHIAPPTNKHFVFINVRFVRADYSTKVFAHTVKPVKTSVRAIVVRVNGIVFANWHCAKIVKVGVAVLFLF